MIYRHLDDELLAAPWQAKALAANPSYVSWGPHEDYMWKEGGGWNSSLTIDTWDEFKFNLDAYNEVVNFYFFLYRPHADCETCGGGGYHPSAHEVVNTFYPHMCGSRVLAWHDKITEDELAALKAAKRVPQKVTVQEVNAAQHAGGRLMHCAINRHILIDARLKRLGLPIRCSACEGSGTRFTREETSLGLTLWVIHPRKGAYRGLEIMDISEAQLPAAFDFLRRAAARNAERFAKLPTPRKEDP